MRKLEKRACPHIVQAEFFHVGAGAKTLEEVCEQIQSRRADAAPIKTAVRFYDEYGAITATVDEIIRLERRRLDLMNDFNHSRGWVRRRVLDWRHGRVMRALQRAKLLRHSQALWQLRRSILESSSGVVVERGFLFRPLKPDEAHELLERAHAAVSVWVFVFAYGGDLCANQGRVLARAM